MKTQRLEDVLIYIKQHKTVSLDTLCEVFDVSKNTIRRDVDALKKTGAIEKVYGGVTFVEQKNLIPIGQRNQVLNSEKRIIGKLAASEVEDHDIIFIDAGTTTSTMIPFLSERKHLTVITNSLTVMNDALGYPEIEVISTGGNLLRETNSFIGIEAIKVLENYNIHKAFIGASGISLTSGITNSSSIEAEIKKTIFKVSDQINLLVDHSKFDHSSLVTFAKIELIDRLVTDVKPNQTYIQYCQENNIEIKNIVSVN